MSQIMAFASADVCRREGFGEPLCGIQVSTFSLFGARQFF